MINFSTRYVPDLRFRHPCCLLISGTTGAGKSHFVKNLIECGGADIEYDFIYYFMPNLETLDIVPQNKTEMFIQQGLPKDDWVKEHIKKGGKKCLIVIDDQWQKSLDCPVVSHLLTHDRRHRDVSLCFISQNFFEKSNNAVTYRNCMTDFVLFNNSNDIYSNQNIARKTGHGKGFKTAMDVFKKRKIVCHNYVILRRHQNSPDDPKTFTNLFGEISGMGNFPWIFGE